MSYYYVAHPNLEYSATVKAPSTDKARTTYLDFLERSGRASRKNRQQLRKNTIADRIEFPEEVDSDVTLYYDYTGSGNGEGNEEPIQVGYEPREEPVEEDYYEPEEPEPEQDTMPVEQMGMEQSIEDTPIGKMSLGSM